ncbi:hypothetical protein J659_3942 [Acinetobacter baumannii 1406589]|nr:hypothetical protein J494_3399 [Acinetobacter baumannii 29280]EXI01397.1 hypothetical protein J644_3741 [Acinetobacter baumannii 480175]EXS53815.1 hypothetical protein J659_3942 [Acinetobacter baumannii 1406589]
MISAYFETDSQNLSFCEPSSAIAMLVQPINKQKSIFFIKLPITMNECNLTAH